jgi:polyisoprenoid-binding protein YceI
MSDEPSALAPGSHRLGPDSATLQVLTFREGMAARVGHDLVLDVTRWEATLDVEGDRATVRLTADPRSLEVREGRRGVKPLTDKDRRDIERTIDDKILRGQPIEFTSREGRVQGGALAVEGDLAIGGTSRPVAARLELGGDGVLRGTVPVSQSDFGITPYRGFMGALKVRDVVELTIQVPG